MIVLMDAIKIENDGHSFTAKTKVVVVAAEIDAFFIVRIN